MANDFSVDSRAKALWKLDNGALLTDSKGTNTLTDTGSVANDTTNKQEGDAAGLFGANRLYINDTNLDAGMPLKQGDTVKKGTWVCWFRLTTVPGSSQYYEIISKWDWGGSKLSLENVVTNSKFRIGWGYSTGQTQHTWDTFTVVANRWYHVAVTFNGVLKTCHVRVWDATAGTATNYDKSDWNGELRISDCPYSLGGNNAVGAGQIDEAVIFNDILSDVEIDLIRAGNYNSTYWFQEVDQAIVQILYEPPPIIKVSNVLQNVEYQLAPITKVSKTLLQVETQRAATGAYVSQALLQVEYFVPTTIEVTMDTLSIEINPLDISLQITQHMDVINMLVEALTLMPSSFGVSVSTENILITPHNIHMAYAVNMSTLAIEIALLVATVELVSKRIFPLPPEYRMLQSQPNKRKFPVGH